MRLIGKLTFQRHEVEPVAELTKGAGWPMALHLYRVVGHSALAAGRLCRQEAEDCTSRLSVAITFEGLKSLGRTHVAVCLAVKQTCLTLCKSFHLCGVTAANRRLFEDAGLLHGIGERNLHGSVAALLPRLCNNQVQRQLHRPPFTHLPTLYIGKDVLALQHGRAVWR